jgi:hypothetical protein
MDSRQPAERCAEAVEALARHVGRDDASRVVAELTAGLGVLRDSLYTRVHLDVEQIVGMDSMLMPVSESRTQRLAKLEIELYQIAVSSAAVARHGYAPGGDAWFRPWLAKLLLDREHCDRRAAERIEFYAAKSPDKRRLAFTDVLASALPESRRAPLVLFRLIPLAIDIVTALAFGDRAEAEQLRTQQIDHLAAIHDCRTCHGDLLENGRQCPECGNPLWTFKWLTMAD